MKIKDIKAREILDSRGNPTVEADVILEDGSMGRASVPSGASTGEHEAIELRDNDKNRYGGKGVLKAVENIKHEIFDLLIGQGVDQRAIDKLMIDLDGTSNKSRLGANAILAVSLALAKAIANSKKISLFKYFSTLSNTNSVGNLLPIPMSNIINGGKHANNSTDIQEFMIMPISANNFSKALQMTAEVFHSLKKVLVERGYGTTVGDEGGFAPNVKNGNREALLLIKEAVEKAGFELKSDFVIALDVAGSEFFKNGKYILKKEGKEMSGEELIEFYENLCDEFSIVSIEDGLDQNDWETWKKMNQTLGQKISLVGDDLLVTNKDFLKRAIEEKACNAILIKLNQIGTLTETIETIDMAKKAGFKTIISHRSGETEDTTIAHLAVGLDSGFIKTGSLSRTDRVAKYNELLRIEEELGESAMLAKFK